MERMEPLCARYGFTPVSERDPARRGSQVAYAHPRGYEIVQALKELDVIADFRTPDVLRFGLTPLYLRYHDLVATVERLDRVCATAAWNKHDYRDRAPVPLARCLCPSSPGRTAKVR